jgi:hypothetical protein
VLWGYAARDCSYGIGLTACQEFLIYYPIFVFDCNRAIWSLRSSITIYADCAFDTLAVAPFVLDKTTIRHDAGLISGSGNAGWGLNLNGPGNIVHLISATAPTISGASGEVTVDGVTDVTWAALASPGDYALDAVTGARVYRQ